MTTPGTIVRRFYDALGGGDVSAVLSLLDAQVEWTEAERFLYYSGTWRSPQAVLDNVLKPLAADWAGFSAKAHEFIAEGDRVVALGTYSGTFKKNRPIIFGRLRPRLDRARRQARGLQHAHRHRKGARSGAELNRFASTAELAVWTDQAGINDLLRSSHVEPLQTGMFCTAR